MDGHLQWPAAHLEDIEGGSKLLCPYCFVSETPWSRGGGGGLAGPSQLASQRAAIL